jgi:hypothetical protein
MKKIAIVALLGLIATAAALPALAYVGTADLGTVDVNPLAPFNQINNRTLSPDTLYTLHGLYYVDAGVTLTIPAGTIIQGVPAATLCIKRGATILAEGTWNQPIIFTSSEAPGDRLPGDWGGVVILGNARVNQPNPVIEGGIIAQGQYGGTDDADNSGVFKYVRIEFAGYRFALNNEINGLTLGGVGSGTEIHHVQVSYGFDDSFECFGGTVNLHHLVAFAGLDDEFDTDFGYRGKCQFLFGLRDPAQFDATGESNGFESDNDGTGTSAWPQTAPIYSNVTLVGPLYVADPLPVGNKFQHAGLLRRNSRTSVFNSVMAGYPRGMSLRNLSVTKAQQDTLRFDNNEVTGNYLYAANMIHDRANWLSVAGNAGLGGWLIAHANLDTIVRVPSVVGLGATMALNSPDAVPQAGSVLIGTASWADDYLADSSFQQVTYRGAFDPALPMSGQWTAWWTNFDPQNIDYALPATPVRDTPVLRASLSNQPNPFNPSTTIQFSAPKAGRATLAVFDLRGHKVASLLDGELAAGPHSLQFSGEGLPSGTYFYRLSGDGYEVTEKMQLVK